MLQKPSIGSPASDADNPSLSLRRYVVGTCYAKMKRRLNHPTLSLPHIASLKDVTTFTFDESKLCQPDKEKKKGEIENDLLFLRRFMLPAIANGRFLPEIPNLIVQAKAISNGESLDLYTKDTCEEFHQLFLHLLLHFQKSLDDLAEARGNAKVPTPGSLEFKREVECVMLLGYALDKLAKGAALRMHLQTIVHLLRHWDIRPQAPMSIPVPEGEQEDRDEDLKEVQPLASVGTPLWKSYGDWLRLLLSHFDAVDILVGYVTGPTFKHSAISIQILVAPPLDHDLLAWPELFNDERFFPTVTVLDPPNNNAMAGIDNAGILDFLNKTLKASSQARNLQALWGKNQRNATVKILETFKSSKVPGWEECATKLLDKLKELSGPPGLDNSDMYREVSDDIDSLCQSTKFFASLHQTQGFTGFSGTLHCEASLASLLGKNPTVSKGILDQMEVGYFFNLFYHQSHSL